MTGDMGLPAYLRLRNAFTRAVEDGTWQPDQAIPSEAELAAQYAVAVGTVRKAIDGLVADRTLQRFQGRGTFVRRPEFNSLLRFFRLVGPDGAPATPKSAILAREVLPATARVVEALKLRAGAKVIRLHRLRLVDEAPILHEEIFIPLARFRPLAKMPLAEMGDLLYPLYERICGQIVAHAQETLTIDVADARDAELLATAQNAPIVVIERIASDHQRAPLEWRTTRGKASGFAYKIDIR
ncbi:MAG: GntR family transcriptional regulator [Hyphomicrobiales bacterium]|nr:GntR family transcriptional regulator [Hyphomicrobiales bacterium]